MSKLTRAVFASLLVFVFSFFSVGVPVVHYLCPMMSSENPVCDMSPVSNSGRLTISTETPSCCAKKIGTERNTTPFLKVEKVEKAPSHEVSVAVSTVEATVQSFSHVSSNPLIQYSTPPLFILHSALLI